MVRTKALAVISAVAATAVAAVAVPAGSATATVRPAAYRLAVSNPGFEVAPAWRASTSAAVVTRSHTPHSGRYSGLLYARSTGSAYMSPTHPLVGRTVAGTTYSVSVWVAANQRGSVPASVQLVEVRSGRVVGSATVRTTATTTYRKVTTSLTARYTGSYVTVRVGASLHRKQALRVDDVYLTARPPAPAAPAPKPTTTSPSPTPSTTAPTPPPTTEPPTTTEPPATTDPTTPPATTEPPSTTTTVPPSTTTPPSTSLRTTAFGTTAQPRSGTLADAVARQDAKFGHLATLRYYAPGLPPSWSTITSLGQRDLVVSFKADPASILRGDADSYLRSWFASAPTDRQIWWTYFHEPENDVAAGAFTPTQFRDAFRHVSQLAQQAGRRDLHATMILMGYTVTKGSGRNWADYYPGADAVDVLGWDVYNHAAAAGTGYSTPENVFGKVIAVSAAAGKPVAIAETGAPLVPGDNGTARAAYLQAAASYLSAAHAAFVTYYDSTQGGAYTLEDAPSVAAWRAWM